MSRGKSCHRRQARRGFTLIEALVALMLVGIVLPVALRGVAMAVQTSGAADRMGEATELCRSKLAELSVAADTAGLTGGGVFPDRPAYSWQGTYVSRDDGTDELTVTVTWMQGGGPRSLSLSTLVYFSATGSTAP